MLNHKKAKAENQQHEWTIFLNLTGLPLQHPNDAFQSKGFPLAAVLSYLYLRATLCITTQWDLFFFCLFLCSPAACCPDTMAVSRRCIQESFCQPAQQCYSMCALDIEKKDKKRKKWWSRKCYCYNSYFYWPLEYCKSREGELSKGETCKMLTGGKQRGE